jgi:hypothetical protein
MRRPIWNPGVAVSRSEQKASLQVYDGSNLDYRFIPYPYEAFRPEAGVFTFSLARIPWYRFHARWKAGPKRALQAPLEGAMRSSVEESLTSRCSLKLTERRRGTERTLFEEAGERAGLEISGDLSPVIRSLIPDALV